VLLLVRPGLVWIPVKSEQEASSDLEWERGQTGAAQRTRNSAGAGYAVARLRATRSPTTIVTPVLERAKSSVVREAVWSETSPRGHPRSSNSLLDRATLDVEIRLRFVLGLFHLGPGARRS